ncbi:MAG: polyphenol oxidase family protein [Akkermansiaceae bacterium]
MEDFLAAINAMSGVSARFLTRVPGVEVDTDKVATVKRLEPFHRAAVEEMKFSWDVCWRAEQVHGAGIKKVVGGEEASIINGVDGLVSADSGIVLGIYVADCGALYVVDQVTGAIGLLHSGKKGTELGILAKALEVMREEFGTKAEDVVVVLGPCIRPPAYEVDFAAEIRRQAIGAGVREENFTDCGVCTSGDLDTYYSYRAEMGATGRMLALLGKHE